MASSRTLGVKVLAKNRKARHDFFIAETLEAGLSLVGTEVKSIRQGKVSLKESYIVIKGGEAFVQSMHITPFEQGNRFNADPLRVRKLLLNKREIRHLVGVSAQQGMTLIPLDLYLKNGLVKMTLGVAKGKKLYDKRHSLQERDMQRQIERTFRGGRGSGE